MTDTAEIQCPRSITDEDRARAQMISCWVSCLTDHPRRNCCKACPRCRATTRHWAPPRRTWPSSQSAPTPTHLEREFNNLFVGLGRGELLPYASYYLTGFLNEKPLAELRSDLRSRGIKARSDVKEPEDHICTLCEIMAGIITGEFPCDSGVASQKAFFDAHLAKWAELFFTDLEEAQSAIFYAPVGSLGRAFMAVEAEAFAIQ